MKHPKVGDILYLKFSGYYCRIYDEDETVFHLELEPSCPTPTTTVGKSFATEQLNRRGLIYYATEKEWLTRKIKS